MEIRGKICEEEETGAQGRLWVMRRLQRQGWTRCRPKIKVSMFLETQEWVSHLRDVWGHDRKWAVSSECDPLIYLVQSRNQDRAMSMGEMSRHPLLQEAVFNWSKATYRLTSYLHSLSSNPFFEERKKCLFYKLFIVHFRLDQTSWISSSEYLFPAGQDLISILQVTMRLLVAVIARPGDNYSPSRKWESSLSVISLSDLSIASHWQLTAQTNATRGEQWCFNYRLPRIWENSTARNETEEWPG